MKQPLAAWRKAAGLTQWDLAKAAGLHPTQVNTYERGHVMPSLESALAIATALRKAGANVRVEDIAFKVRP